MVHLDLKPENLLFSELGAVRVGDLGCASHVAEGAVTPARDVFSLGLVARECMTHETMPTGGERWLRLRRERVRMEGG